MTMTLKNKKWIITFVICHWLILAEGNRYCRNGNARPDGYARKIRAG